jgi:hypothetical protein
MSPGGRGVGDRLRSDQSRARRITAGSFIPVMRTDAAGGRGRLSVLIVSLLTGLG